MSKALALELAPAGIRCNCLAPGNMRTPMNEHWLAVPTYEEAMIASTPCGRVGTVEDISSVAVFLASDATRYMHGTTVAVDGGWTAG